MQSVAIAKKQPPQRAHRDLPPELLNDARAHACFAAGSASSNACTHGGLLPVPVCNSSWWT